MANKTATSSGGRERKGRAKLAKSAPPARVRGAQQSAAGSGVTRGSAARFANPTGRAARAQSVAIETRRMRGRPKAEAADDVREQILAAARALFTKYGFRAVSSRQIATAAGANVAMIRYYFGGKQGLYQQLLNEAKAPINTHLEDIGEGESPSLEELLAGVIRIHATHSWVAGLVLREVIAPDGPMRPTFIKEIPGRFVPKVLQLLENAKKSGHLRADLDPALTVMSVLSLAVFPFLAFPVTSALFGMSRDDAFIQKFIEHTTRVMQHGLFTTAAGEGKQQ